MRTHSAQSAEELLLLIGEQEVGWDEPGPLVIQIGIWDGRTICAQYYDGPKYENPDAETQYETFFDFREEHDQLVPLIYALLATGKSFVTATGSDDQVCVLEWTIA